MNSIIPKYIPLLFESKMWLSPRNNNSSGAINIISSVVFSNLYEVKYTLVILQYIYNQLKSLKYHYIL